MKRAKITLAVVVAIALAAAVLLGEGGMTMLARIGPRLVLLVALIVGAAWLIRAAVRSTEDNAPPGEDKDA